MSQYLYKIIKLKMGREKSLRFRHTHLLNWGDKVKKEKRWHIGILML